MLFFWGGIINRSTFSPFLLIFTCTEDSLVGKKKSYLFDCVHYLISEFGNKRDSLKSESETSKKKRLLADSLLPRGPGSPRE